MSSELAKDLPDVLWTVGEILRSAQDDMTGRLARCSSVGERPVGEVADQILPHRAQLQLRRHAVDEVEAEQRDEHVLLVDGGPELLEALGSGIPAESQHVVVLV